MLLIHKLLEETRIKQQFAPRTLTALQLSHLGNFIRDVVRPVFDFRRDDGLLRGRRGGALLVVVDLREVECDERDLVDGAVLVEVGVGRGAEQAGLDVAERP